MSSFLDSPPASAPNDPPPNVGAEEEPRAVGAPRGEEFDLSQMDKFAKEPSATAHTWNWRWFVVAGVLALYCLYFVVFALGVGAQIPLPLGPVLAQNGNAAKVRVHVAGGVNHPGVYTMRADSRVTDAVRQAGGATAGADPDALNLAAFVEDGGKIIVPFKVAPTPRTTPTPIVIVREVPAPTPALATEIVPLPTTSAYSLPAAPLTKFGSAPRAATRAAPKPKKKSDNIPLLRAHPVSLNHATAEQLQQLPGVGPKMAERILAYRAENRRFKSVADLRSVKGVGVKKMEVLKDLVTVK